MKIATIACIQNHPINTGGKSYSFFVNSTLAKEHQVAYYFFDTDTYDTGFTSKILAFTSTYIQSPFASLFSLFPSFIRKLHFEFLFDTRELLKIECDIVILEFPYLYHIAKIISKNNGNCPIILLAHNVEWQYYQGIGSPLWKLVRIFESRILPQVSKILALSSNDATYFQKAAPNVPTALLAPGVVEEFFSPEGNKAEFDMSKKHILFYGRMDNPVNKEALEYLKNEVSPKLSLDWQLHILGTQGISSEYFQNTSMINEGMVQNPFDYIRACDVVIVTLKSPAGVKMRILESLYCEKIILASSEAVKGLPSELGESVIVCHDASEYITILHQLFTDNGFYQQHLQLLQEKVKDYKKKTEQTLLDAIKI